MKLRTDHPVTAAHRVLGEPRAAEIERAALTSAAHFGLAILGMQRTHARLQPGGRQQQAIVDLDLAGVHRAGHHHTGPGQHEAAIDGEPREAGGALAALAQRQQTCLQVGNALSGQRRHRQDLRALEGGRGEQRLDLGHALQDLVVVGKVGLGERHDAAIES